MLLVLVTCCMIFIGYLAFCYINYIKKYHKIYKRMLKRRKFHIPKLNGEANEFLFYVNT